MSTFLDAQPGGGFCEDFSLDLQLPDFTAQVRQLLTLGGRQSMLTSRQVVYEFRSEF